MPVPTETLVATGGILLDVSGALVITVPAAFESRGERERRARMSANAQHGRSVWWGAEVQAEWDRTVSRNLALFGADRNRARWALGLVVAGVLCNLTALWLHFL